MFLLLVWVVIFGELENQCSLILEMNDSYDPIFVNQNILWVKYSL